MKMDMPTRTPWGQSYRIAFFMLYGVSLLAAGAWLFSSIHEVAPDSRAVVFHFGRPERVEHAGLLFAWPQPVDRVVLVPGAERIMEREVRALQRNVQMEAVNSWEREGDAGAGAGYLLTGDAGVVQLNVRVFYRVSNPIRFALQRTHIDPLIDRLTQRAATVVCVGRDLDTILVARPEVQQSDAHAAEERIRLRNDFKQAMTHSLEKLAANGSDPGITIERIDISSSLPANAMEAFNAVLTASQQAEQLVASARNDASLRMQKAQQQADRVLQQAQASGEEKVAKAQVDTQVVFALAQARQKGVDGGMLQRIWRENMTVIMSRAGQVTTVVPGQENQLILQSEPPTAMSLSSTSDKTP